MKTTLSFTLKEACDILETHVKQMGLEPLTNVWFTEDTEPLFYVEIEFMAGEANASR